MSKKLTLKHPYKFGEETISELALRRPRGKDIRECFDKHETEWARIFELGARLTGRAPSELEDMDGADAMQLRKVINDFLGGSEDPAAKG